CARQDLYYGYDGYTLDYW
nr:immunoglobulin heavy chain junction region [Mus musculus]MBK4198550.1 immunoglobulin heavy chain junction region [Mus musculus]